MIRICSRDGVDGVDDAFVDLPHALHADDPHWIPEERAAVLRAFSVANPWFARGRARTFTIPGRARLAAFRDPASVIDGAPAAFAGYMAERMPGDAAPLFREAERWARAEGAGVLYGPVDFTTLGNYRLRTDAGDEGLPFPGEPYNPTWYDASIRTAGFRPVRHYLTQEGVVALDTLDTKRERRDALVREGFTFEPLDAAMWRALLPELHRVADEVFGESFAYTPVAYAAFAAQVAPLGERMIPHLSLLARAPDGALAGFLLVNPHYGPLVVRSAGSCRVPVSALSFAEHGDRLARAGVRTAIAKTLGVVRAHRERGLMDAMGVTAVERAAPTYDRWIAALIRDGNHSARFGARYATGVRTYALYSKMLNDDAG